ncbi:NACHT domain-containing protein [Streptomyces sp. TLI_55]|uniref:NACHT domain-containing protein n=1 Tax=Streptomyces sp. TLI_55 TaxID=1938861 RepID=UPI000BE24474|nr:hypothetical protein [Streptomyces sp. TLI_55]
MLMLIAGFWAAFTFVENEKLLDGVVAVAGTLLVAPLLWAGRILAENSRSTGDDASELLAKAAEALAKEASALYRERRGNRRLDQTERPVPVRWAWAHQEGVGLPEAVAGPGAVVGTPSFAVLPGAEAASPDTLNEGELNELFDVYAGIRTGRMAVLGELGSGKSAAAVLLAVKALAHREGLGEAADRAQVPVPILLTPYGWNPGRQTVDEWLAERLVSDFKTFRGHRFDPRTPTRLINEGRIALFLDGFDEIDRGKRVAALEALHGLSRRVRVVIFSRSEEFTQALHTQPLSGAAVLELQPVAAETAADCFADWQTAGLPPRLRERLAEHLWAQPHGVLGQALSTPLMLTLLRDAFRGMDAQEATAVVDRLLSPSEFTTVEEIDDYLLDRVLPAAYPPSRPGVRTPYSRDQAERWLGLIAARMTAHGTPELAWWQMHEWASASWRIVGGVIGGGLAAGLASALVSRFTDDLGERTVIGFLPASVVGGVLGLATAIVTERRATRVTFPGGSGEARFNLGMGLMAGLAVGSAVALTVGPASGPATAATVGLAAALTAGTATGMAAGGEGLPPPHFASDPNAKSVQRFLGRLIAGSPAGLAAGIPAGLAGGIPLGLAQGTQRGLGVGLAIGCAYVLAFGLLDGFTRITPDQDSPVGPLSGWDQDRRQGLATGLVFGLAMGFAAGLTDALATARHDPLGVAVPVGLITGVVIGAVTGTAAGLTVSNSWRTAVVFVQLWAQGVVPLRAMRFLDDACKRQVLRETGPTYQFRHTRLRDRLTVLAGEQEI